VIKFVQFLRFLYAPPTGSTFDTQLTQTHDILSSAKVTGGRFSKCRKLASEVVSAGRAPLIGDLPVFMNALFSRLQSTLEESLQRSEELGEVRGPPFNSGIDIYLTLSTCARTPIHRHSYGCPQDGIVV
jgi:hypothetical protein